MTMELLNLLLFYLAGFLSGGLMVIVAARMEDGRSLNEFTEMEWSTLCICMFGSWVVVGLVLGVLGANAVGEYMSKRFKTEADAARKFFLSLFFGSMAKSKAADIGMITVAALAAVGVLVMFVFNIQEFSP